MAEDKEMGNICDLIEGIQKYIEEMEWQQLLTPFPNQLGVVECDPRDLVLLYLSWLLTDLCDNNWEGFSAKDMVRILRDITNAIENCTQPF